MSPETVSCPAARAAFTFLYAAWFVAWSAVAQQQPEIPSMPGEAQKSQLSSQDNTIEIHVGPLTIPGAGGGAPLAQTPGGAPVWVRAGRWTSQPGASGWQYAAGDQKDASTRSAATKPPSWSRDVQPAWANQAGPQPSLLAQWVNKGREKDITPGDPMAKLMGERVDQLKDMDKIKDGDDKMMAKIMGGAAIRMVVKQREKYTAGESLKGWQQKYLDAGASLPSRAGQSPASDIPEDKDDDDDDEEGTLATVAPVFKAGKNSSTNLSSISHAFEERVYPAMMLLCGQSQSFNQDNHTHMLAETERIMDDLESYFDGENSLGIPQVPNRPWFGIWRLGQNQFRVCNWLSQGKDYPPKPDSDSGLELVAVPANNYYARVFSGRGSLHQIEDFTSEARALLEDVRRAGLRADETTIYVDSYNPVRDTHNRRDEILVKKVN